MNTSPDEWKNQQLKIEDVIKNLRDNELFEDGSFEPTTAYKFEEQLNVKWLRPKDICEKPVLGFDSTHPKDVVQGSLNNCSLISVFTSLAMHKNFLKKIFGAIDLALNDKNYKGFVCLKLWLNGCWHSIYVDDRLPTIDGRPVFAHSLKTDHYWVSLVEKAFAKIVLNYENLIGIDAAFVIQTLTSGLVLRLNPLNLNHRESILSHLNRVKSEGIMLAIIGSELFNENEAVNANGSGVDQSSGQRRIGHSYAVLDIFRSKHSNDQIYLKVRNSQMSLKIKDFEQYNREIFKREAVSAKKIESYVQNGIFYLPVEDFYKFYEILNMLVVVVEQSKSKSNGLDAVCHINGHFNVTNSFLKNEKNINYMEKYLNSLHYLIEIKNKNEKESTELIFNLISENGLVTTDYRGIFILPVRSRVKKEDGESFLFVDFNIQKPKLLNTNPYCVNEKLLDGYYLIGLVSTRCDETPKSFLLRMANVTNIKCIINHEFKKVDYQSSTNIVYEAKIGSRAESLHQIKLIPPKCCICECLLAKSIIATDTKIYCLECYNASFKCYRCAAQVGKEYYTIDNRLMCEMCLNKAHLIIN